MTNEQLKGARKAQNRFPELVFRIVPEGVRVGSQIVEVTQHMSAEDVFKACQIAAARNG